MSVSFKHLLAAGLLAMPFCVLAAGTATIQGQDGSRFTLEYDGSQLRLESSRHRNVHLIANGDSVYAVTTAAGQPLVVSGGAVMSLLSAQGGQKFATGSEDIRSFTSLTSTGRYETVAGIRGAIHQLKYVDRGGRQRTEEIVLSEHPEVAQMTRSFGRAAAAFQQGAGVDNEGSRALLRELENRNLGLLRFANHYQVVALQTTAPSPARFQLPAAPMQLPGLQGLGSLIPGLGGAR